MLNGVLVAYGIILVSIPIPIVHFVSLPLAPFIAGFVGGGVAKADEGQITIFGLIVGGLALAPAAVLLVITLGFDVSLLNLNRWFVVIAASVLPVYTWFGVTLGALVSYMFRQKERKQNERDQAGSTDR